MPVNIRLRMIGDFRVWRLPESEGPIGASLHGVFSATEERITPHRDWLEPQFMTPGGEAILGTLCFVIRTPSHVIVYETCIGNDKTREAEYWTNLQNPYLETLASIGVKPEDVDFVIISHLHPDHVGWCTRLVDGQWLPTFPNARYILTLKEWEYGKACLEGVDYMLDSIIPVFEAGKFDFVEPDAVICEGVRLEDLRGHTPGHVGLHLKSGDQELVIAGDLMHHPVQVADPDLITVFDVDAAEGTRVRKAFLERYADSGVLVGATHFVTPTFGTITRRGDGLRFEAVPEPETE